MIDIPFVGSLFEQPVSALTLASFYVSLLFTLFITLLF